MHRGKEVMIFSRSEYFEANIDNVKLTVQIAAEQ